jgi:hypothetical protein
MSFLYLYAITDGPELELPALAGVDGGALDAIRCGALQAVVSPLAGAQVALSRARLLEHEAVVEALMGRRAVLPARFGAVAAPAQVAAALERHGPLLAANLARVRGRVEIGLRALWAAPAAAPEPPPPPDRSDGRAYMRSLLAAAQRDRRRQELAEAVAAEIAAAVAGVADAETHELLPAPRWLLKAAFLVRRERVPELRRRIAAIGAAHGELALMATGPWPAYSFTDVPPGAAGAPMPQEPMR